MGGRISAKAFARHQRRKTAECCISLKVVCWLFFISDTFGIGGSTFLLRKQSNFECVQKLEGGCLLAQKTVIVQHCNRGSAWSVMEHRDRAIFS